MRAQLLVKIALSITNAGVRKVDRLLPWNSRTSASLDGRGMSARGVDVWDMISDE